MSLLTPEILASVLDALPNGIYLVDLQRRIHFWNSGAESITGYLRQEVLGRFCPDNLLMHCEDQQNLLCGECCPLAGTMHDGKARDVDVFLRHKGGLRVPVRVRSVAIRDERGAIVGVAETFDERVHFPGPDSHLHDLAARAPTDALTGVPGHETILAQLCASLSDYSRDAIPFGVLGIVVEGLEALTHSRGRRATEAMLRVVAQTIQKNLRPEDLLGRWSEDRFIVVVEQCPPAALARIADLFSRIMHMVALPWWGDQVPVVTRVGATVAHPGDSAATLMERVEQALAPEQSGEQPRIIS